MTLPASSPPRGGRKTAKKPRTELGEFLLNFVQQHKTNRSTVAKRLGVEPYVVTRLIYEDTPTLLRRWRVDEIDAAFGFESMNRRKFLELMRQAGLAAMLPTTKKSWLDPASSTPSLDLDNANEIAELLEVIIEQAPQQVMMVQTKARQWMDQLETANAIYRDKRIAQAQLRFGMLFARTQESTIDWSRRRTVCIATYSKLEQIVLQFPVGELSHEHARIFERRAPFYRQLGKIEQSCQEFTLAIGEVEHDDRYNLLFTLYRNRAHIHAQTGNERLWRDDLEQSRWQVDHIHGDIKANFLDLISYSEGEGLKRLAASPLPFPSQQRKAYARAGLIALASARNTAHEHWRGHLLMIEVAEAETMMWLDLNESLKRCIALKPIAQICLPSIVPKINRLQNAIEQFLNAPHGKYL